MLIQGQTTKCIWGKNRVYSGNVEKIVITEICKLLSEEQIIQSLTVIYKYG
jgi:hypothetical protein